MGSLYSMAILAPPRTATFSGRLRSFGEDYYTYQILIDLKVSDGFAVLTQPHPRFLLDRGVDEGAHWKRRASAAVRTGRRLGRSD